MGIVDQYLLQLNTQKQRLRRAVVLLTALSFLVVLGVSWNLRQTGVALANDACCGYEEHRHTEECIPERVLICQLEGAPPTAVPTVEPTVVPTVEPTVVPTVEPTVTPIVETEALPAIEPEEMLSEAPEEVIAEADEEVAVVKPTAVPTADPTATIETEAETHIHSEECYETAYSCGLEEHIHRIICYSDTTADLEDRTIWAASVPELTGDVGKDIVLVAQSQLGVSESALNFELAADGVTQNGITRYGQWYGNPYGDWANMFTSFCLRYAGLTDVPVNSGAEAMRLGWEERGTYRYAGGYEPLAGDIVFLDKNQNGTAEATAVVVKYFDFVLTVIEGDVDNAVVQRELPIDDPAVVGYGVTNPGVGLMFAAAPTAAAVTVGNTVTYSNSLLQNGGSFIVYTIGSDGSYYALDGNGNAVPIQISGTGSISADISDPNLLYWEFSGRTTYDNTAAYYIRNSATGRYLHPNRDSGSYGPLHSGQWESALYTAGNGVKIRGARQNAYVRLDGSTYTVSDNRNGGSTMYFGRAPTPVTLWLDGTNGNIMDYRGSNNTAYTVYTGVPMELPSAWRSPTKYHYKLAGWVNIETGEYYKPGEMITVTKNTVLYADWVANTYDIGQYNTHVVDTVSTSDFITTRVFDYSSLINLHSSRVTVNASASGHSETWSHVASGNVTYKGNPTLNFSFNDHDSAGTITSLNNLNDPNSYTGGTAVYPGIYNSAIYEALFSINNLYDPETDTGVVGKHYLGQGDHLFQINTDPTSQYYGYYYYDADLNAAAYNQSEQRFYVYDYLVKASDSEDDDYSDFLPLNSIYANNNGRNVATFNHNGKTNYIFESRYDSGNNAKANLWFGMSVEVQFGLPGVPGGSGASGQNANKDIYGNDMHFRFTGDDDVWILIDGKVVLDLGGIHQAADGDINFATGEIRVNGQPAGTLQGVGAGEHTLTILYLERGASMSNCAMYFNLAPRFSLTLQKEDVLTQKLLEGAIFEFYYDRACTQPCELWTSRRSYKNGDAPTNTFTITNGQADVWGLNPSSTYYIREVAPPNNNPGGPVYERSKGVIRLTLDKNGLNSYSATILEELDANGNEIPITHGYTVHGFRIDEENQAAYVSVTNAQNWVTETTSIAVEKIWDDNKNHTYDGVTVYLNVTDPNGQVRRLREIRLSEENDWKYVWSNLPKYIQDPETLQQSTTLVQYSISEAYVPGYMGQITGPFTNTVTEEAWEETVKFENGKVYVLKTDRGFLSTVSKTSDKLCFVAESVAKESSLALWTATVSGNLVKLTNGEGQVLTCQRSQWCFNAANSGGKTDLTPYANGTGLSLAAETYQNEWYTEKINLCELREDGYLRGDGTPLIFHPMFKRTVASTVPVEGVGYIVTNTPLESETALKVTKAWDYPNGDPALYEKAQITMKLYADGKDTGRTETVSLKNNWTATFKGLPYAHENGTPIVYTVKEVWDDDDWIPIYGEVTTVSGGKNPTYETTVTNRYRWIDAFELPSTGGIGLPLYMLCGLMLASVPIVYGLSLRRKHERRSTE